MTPTSSPPSSSDSSLSAKSNQVFNFSPSATVDLVTPPPRSDTKTPLSATTPISGRIPFTIDQSGHFHLSNHLELVRSQSTQNLPIANINNVLPISNFSAAGLDGETLNSSPGLSISPTSLEKLSLFNWNTLTPLRQTSSNSSIFSFIDPDPSEDLIRLSQLKNCQLTGLKSLVEHRLKKEITFAFKKEAAELGVKKFDLTVSQLKSLYPLKGVSFASYTSLKDPERKDQEAGEKDNTSNNNSIDTKVLSEFRKVISDYKYNWENLWQSITPDQIRNLAEECKTKNLVPEISFPMVKRYYAHITDHPQIAAWPTQIFSNHHSKLVDAAIKLTMFESQSAKICEKIPKTLVPKCMEKLNPALEKQAEETAQNIYKEEIRMAIRAAKNRPENATFLNQLFSEAAAKK